MDQLLSALKDYTAIVGACLAAAVSITNLIWTTHLNEDRKRRKVLWERELNRFAELEDTAGHLVGNLLSYIIRSNEERSAAREKLQGLRAVTGDSSASQPSLLLCAMLLTQHVGISRKI